MKSKLFIYIVCLNCDINLMPTGDNCNICYINGYPDKDLIKVQYYKCLNCDTEISIYYNEEYKGYRGKCSLCKIDFPLD